MNMLGFGWCLVLFRCQFDCHHNSSSSHNSYQHSCCNTQHYLTACCFCCRGLTRYWLLRFFHIGVNDNNDVSTHFLNEFAGTRILAYSRISGNTSSWWSAYSNLSLHKRSLTPLLTECFGASRRIVSRHVRAVQRCCCLHSGGDKMRLKVTLLNCQISICWHVIVPPVGVRRSSTTKVIVVICCL